jgi:hypothetical protein
MTHQKEAGAIAGLFPGESPKDSVDTQAHCETSAAIIGNNKPHCF